MPACIQELHSKGMQYPVLIGGAAINRAFSYRALYPGGKESDEQYGPGVFYCKDAFEGLSVMDQLIDDDAHGALLNWSRDEPVPMVNFSDRDYFRYLQGHGDPGDEHGHEPERRRDPEARDERSERADHGHV